jgi:acetoin utilization deacetylase AcuC-like enzyme
MQTLAPFGARLSSWQKRRQRANPALAAYWRASKKSYRWILGAVIVPSVVVPVLAALVGSGGTDALNISRYLPVQALLLVPWPITVIALLVIGGSLVAARRAELDRRYYAAVGASARGYTLARLNYPAIAAQSSTEDTSPTDDGQAVFDSLLYTERTGALGAYERFVNQRDKRILLVVGHGGSGKSTFLLHRMGELAGAHPGEMPYRTHPCLFINCRVDHITSDNDLVKLINSKLEKDLALDMSLDRLLRDAVRGRHDRALVIFIDAINENISPDGSDINQQLTDFAQHYLRGDHEIYLCVSVRRTYWEEQRHRYAEKNPNTGWLAYAYPPEPDAATSADKSAQTASVLLDAFDETEFPTAYEKHRRVYGITGTIPGARTREVCGNPLMLQMFCIAFRGRDISHPDVVLNLLRNLDIFDEYAKGALTRARDLIGMTDDGPTHNGETHAQRAIRALVLELALETVETGSQFLPGGTILTVARERARAALDFPKIGVDTVDALFEEGTVLRAILAEGVILVTGNREDPDGREDTGVRFVSEHYLEYSIGRALARRWRLERLSADAICEDFERRMAQHRELSRRGFNNLRQGLGIAVLVAEQPASGLATNIHLRLLDLLVRHPDFDWNQLACQMIQQMKPFNRASADKGPDHRREVRILLDKLDELAKKDDFVLRWDVEWALERAVEAGEADVVLTYLTQWMLPTSTFAQRLFSGESLGFIFERRPDQRRNIIDALRGFIDDAYGPEFWILRSLMFSIGTMLDTLDSDTAADAALSAELRSVAQDLLGLARTWWDRSVVLAGLIKGAAPRDRTPSAAFDWAAESPWTRVNAALATEPACARGHCTLETIALLRALRQASAGYDPYLDWALWHVSYRAGDAVDTPPPVRAEALRLVSYIEDEARERLADDRRAGWILTAQLTGGDAPTGDATSSVALVYHPEYGHTDLHNHPESKERVQVVLDFLERFRTGVDTDQGALVTHVSPHRFSEWDDKMLDEVHEDEWIRRVRDLSEQLAGGEKNIVLESDIEVRAGSYEGAVLAARGVVAAVDVVIGAPAVRLAVALVRPPGHLAGNKICIFNNVAVAARYAQQKLAGRRGGSGRRPRVLIVDCDAHHGKSTQDIFYADDSVLYFSTHQAGLHPGTGQFAERGDGAGHGYTVNVPIPAHCGDRVYAEVLRRILEPILANYRPELILVSMGLDAYHHDDFSQLELSEYSYWLLATTLHQYQRDSADGEQKVGIVASLEGGYDLESMGRCVSQFMRVLGDWDPPGENGPSLRPPMPVPQRVSMLDEYLLSADHGPELPALPDSDIRWQADLTNLETGLSRQWAGP